MPLIPHEHRLMAKRIHEVLFVSSPYDLYMMEEEGLLADRISDEYTLLHLTSAPAITRVSTAEEAIEAVRNGHFDLVVTGTRVGKGRNASDMARAIKDLRPEIPVALLTPKAGPLPTARRPGSAIDKTFYWQGDTRLFLAIIKSFEDRANAPRDCLEEHVRAIILVEDSPQFTSTYLPLIYTEIMVQTRSLIAEGATADEKLQHMMTRPKILMAETYEEAIELYARYRDNILGIVSDVRFPRGGVIDPEAGFAFTALVKGDNPDVPVLLQSQDSGNAARASELGASYADKNSPHLLAELRHFIKSYFGFGDFVFRLPDGREVGRVSTLLEVEKAIAVAPAASIEYHSIRNHFSNWFFARGEFEIAAKIRPLKISDFPSLDDLRRTICQSLREARLLRQRRTIARFSERNLDLSMPFMRFGGGSIGGKGRGIGFMSKMLTAHEIAERFPGHEVLVPQTLVIGTDAFDHFLDRNRLHQVAIEGPDDAAIASAFLQAELEPKIVEDLTAFLHRTDGPLAVRSSSLSEDSLSQPFAGLYATYFLPNNHPSFEERLRQFLAAIKLVYASTFFANPKAFMEANRISIEAEKMAVVIQRIVGRQHGNFFYPDVAGVAQSYNFFPVGYLKPEDGIAELVLGLGTMAVRGERALRFCPRYPAILPQFGRPRDIVARSQRAFHALDTAHRTPHLFTNESLTLASLPLEEAELHGSLTPLGGVYSPEDDVIYEGLGREGLRVLTFSRLLSGSIFPLPAIISEILEIGSDGLGCPVEMEFAANLPQGDAPAQFWFLQIRPLVSGEEAEEVDVSGIGRETCIATSVKAMGNGTIGGITDIVVVRPDTFDILRTAEIAADVGRINAEMVRRGEHYVLLGFGRWGTANPRLGIPVAYSQISHAKVICEVSTPEMDVEPSQGTHFFHNIASCRIGYLSIEAQGDADFIDWEWFERTPAERETPFLKHIKCPRPITTQIDGRSGRGVILKP
jgi:Pyruvate phosphate dikinase, AMP/ATP-binding domain